MPSDRVPLRPTYATLETLPAIEEHAPRYILTRYCSARVPAHLPAGLATTSASKAGLALVPGTGATAASAHPPTATTGRGSTPPTTTTAGRHQPRASTRTAHRARSRCPATARSPRRTAASTSATSHTTSNGANSRTSCVKVCSAHSLPPLHHSLTRVAAGDVVFADVLLLANGMSKVSGIMAGHLAFLGWFCRNR